MQVIYNRFESSLWLEFAAKTKNDSYRACVCYRPPIESIRNMDDNDTLLSQIQSNLDDSNTDGSFTMANSNSFLSPYEILLIAQENKYLRKFSYFIVKLYVVCTH